MNANDQVITFDIFGSISSSRDKVKTLGNIKHRESEKNKFAILQLNEQTTLGEYVSKLKQISEIIEQSMSKFKNTIEIPIYKTGELQDGLNVFYINPENALKHVNQKETNLYKIILKENTNCLAFTNIMYYNNVKIKIGNKIYYPDTVDWKQNPDAFPELKISTRISPYNLDTTSNLSITNVIFNPPATIVFWSDKTKTVVKSTISDEGIEKLPKEEYDPEKGIAMAICKKMIGDNKRDYYNVFLHWVKKYDKQRKEMEDEIDGLLDNGGDLEDD